MKKRYEFLIGEVAGTPFDEKKKKNKRTRKVDQMILPVNEDDDQIIAAIDSLL
ncbi:8976_t:CDS:2, partial [Dentiscutata erythropus]